MKAGRFINGWTVAAVLLAAVIIASGAVIWSKHDRSGAIEITLSPESEAPGRIYVGGEVHNPGFYPLKAGDSIEDVLRAAGGVIDGADLSRVELTVAAPEDGDAPQKINVNRAEVWLLAALPGIGEVRAQAIVDYRGQNGPFRDIDELLKIDGLGDVTFERIEHLITVAD
jgi:competence protein ComEA